MKRTLLLITVVHLLAGLTADVGVVAQEPAPTQVTQTLSVFLDCSGRSCDRDHFRREIEWVNWARDRNDADVHLLVTTQQTGGNGWQYTLDYIGLGGFDGANKSLSHTSDANDTDAEVRDALTQTIALGLVQYAENTSVGSMLRIQYRPLRSGAAPARVEEHDPWNLWMFRVSVNGNVEREAQQNSYSIGGSGSADRVTEDLKINLDLRGEYEHETYVTSDGSENSYVSEDYSANLLMVWSLGNNWSVGGKANADRSTYENRDLAVSGGPAIEFNFFPYSESTRRSVTLRYGFEVVSFNYEEITVEVKMDEVLPRHSLTLSSAIQQPWGDINGSIEAIQYLHELATHRINVSGRIEYRIFRGLNLNFGGSFSRIKDQFYLSAAGLEDDDILLERLDRETDFSYDLRAGFSIVFGSKFANIVNPRMGRRRGFYGRH
jgi:hypothetical protein